MTGQKDDDYTEPDNAAPGAPPASGLGGDYVSEDHEEANEQSGSEEFEREDYTDKDVSGSVKPTGEDYTDKDL